MASPLPSPPPSADPTWRYERKFEARGVPLAQIEMLLRLHPAGFRIAFPDRDVNNVYLDQPDLRSFRTHVNGAMKRQKFRIRWYGAAHDASRPVLEVKRKQGLVGTKSRFSMPAFPYDADFDFEPMRREALARIDEGGVAEFVAGAAPVVFNRYHRRYLLSADRRFRLTIDTALRFERIRRAGLGSLARFEERDLAILELKYAMQDDADATRIASRFPFRLGKYSKYLQGISRLTQLAA